MSALELFSKSSLRKKKKTITVAGVLKDTKVVLKQPTVQSQQLQPSQLPVRNMMRLRPSLILHLQRVLHRQWLLRRWLRLLRTLLHHPRHPTLGLLIRHLKYRLQDCLKAGPWTNGTSTARCGLSKMDRLETSFHLYRRVLRVFALVKVASHTLSCMEMF